MKLKINKKEDKIFVKFADISLKISKDSDEWNDQGINNFLIQIASKIPEEDKIEIEYKQEEQNNIYKHIVSLFKTFANAYNENQ